MGVGVMIYLMIIGIGVTIILVSGGIFYGGLKLWKKTINNKFEKIVTQLVGTAMIITSFIIIGISLYYIAFCLGQLSSI